MRQYFFFALVSAGGFSPSILSFVKENKVEDSADGLNRSRDTNKLLPAASPALEPPLILLSFNYVDFATC